ncbi:DNA breaking-rejoining enzyme, partial [Gymnopus androsaceus JB14]
RPNIRAKDRLHAWQTPFSIEKRLTNSSIFPPEIIELGDKAVFAGLADSTKQSYGAGPLRWNQFCDQMSIPESLRMPANETLIIAFIGFHMGKVSGSCVKNWLSGLRAWHELAGAPWPASSRLIRFARTAARTAGANCKRPQRNPITLAHMLALYVALDFSIPFHCAIWAVASIAFWGCRRLGELTIPSKNGFNPKYHASRTTNISFSMNPDRSRKAVTFRIPWSKTTKELGASVVGTAQHQSLQILCPSLAIERHMAANAYVPPTFSLFAYLDDQGSPHHMVKSTFLAFCDRIWKSAGLEHVHGHSFRIGGAVELLLAGVTPEVVAAVGGWTSLAFLLYWRRFEDILPTHILKAYDSGQISRLKRTLDNYQKANNIPNSLIDACISGIDITED